MDEQLSVHREDELYASYLNSFRARHATSQSYYDSSLHTCDLFAYPARLHPNHMLEVGSARRAHLSALQKLALSECFESLIPEISIIGELWSSFKGLWLNYHLRDFMKAHKNFSYMQQNCLVLEFLVPGGDDAVSMLVRSRAFDELQITGAALSVEQLRSMLAFRLIQLLSVAIHPCEHFELTPCALCGEEFLPQGAVSVAALCAPRFCATCFSMINGQGTYNAVLAKGFDKAAVREDFIFGLKIFVNTFGYVPGATLKRHDAIREVNDSLVSGDTIDAHMKALALLPSPDAVHSVYKTWAHFLNAADMLSLTKRGKGGYQSIATDGHLCLSLGERRICEYLYSLSLRHQKEPTYPKHPLLNPLGALRADFLVKDLWVEFAGRLDDAAYKARMEVKRRLAAELSLNWVQIAPADLRNLGRLLAPDDC